MANAVDSENLKVDSENLKVDSETLKVRLRKLMKANPDAGYKTAHGILIAEEEFQTVAFHQVKKAMTKIREEPAPKRGSAGPGENIQTAASDGDMERVEKLMVMEGFTSTSADENGYTAVHGAASWGRADILKMLLERSDCAADAANVRDSDGDTPLHHVAECPELEDEQLSEVISLLLDAKADPKLTNNEGKNAFDVCANIPDEEEGETEVEVNVRFLKLMADRGYHFEVPEVKAEDSDESHDDEDQNDGEGQSEQSKKKESENHSEEKVGKCEEADKNDDEDQSEQSKKKESENHSEEK